jgi:type I restriction enzyme S subunit
VNNYKHLNLEDLPNVTVAMPNPLVQKYIGDKVRQAERLRAWAKLLEIKINGQFESLSENPPRSQTTWRVSPDVLEPYRINPNQYNPVVLELLNRAKIKGIILQPLSDLMGVRGLAGGATPKGASYIDSGVLFARVQNVKPLSLDLGDAVFIDAATDAELARSRCKENDVILTITGYPGTASLVIEEDLPVNINQHSVRFDVKHGVGAGYICAALNSRFLKYQIDRASIGGTRDALDYPSVKNLLIPRFDSHIEEDINEAVLNVIAGRKLSKKLTNVAKLLVEGLIEGLVTEAELIAAQQGLEAGDTEADAAILRRLKMDGLDGKGQPLFGDVERVYELLGQAKTEDVGA